MKMKARREREQQKKPLPRGTPHVWELCSLERELRSEDTIQQCDRKGRPDEPVGFREQSEFENAGTSSDEAEGNIMPGNERGQHVDTRRSPVVRVGSGETHHGH